MRVTPRKGAPAPHPAADALQRATGALSTAAMARMEADMPWFRELSAEDRSWVGVIVQAGIRGFVDWYRRADADQPAPGSTEMVASVFGAAPRALAGVINLQQTVDLVRLSIEVVEGNVGGLDYAIAVDEKIPDGARTHLVETVIQTWAKEKDIELSWEAFDGRTKKQVDDMTGTEVKEEVTKLREVQEVLDNWEERVPRCCTDEGCPVGALIDQHNEAHR